jgi:hypothetical protein
VQRYLKGKGVKNSTYKLTGGERDQKSIWPKNCISTKCISGVNEKKVFLKQTNCHKKT